jgi:hypothetical protein
MGVLAAATALVLAVRTAAAEEFGSHDGAGPPVVSK